MYENKKLTHNDLFHCNNVVRMVRELNNVNGIGDMVTQRTIANLGFLSNALAGEAGELANVVKKIWRDGESPERMAHLGEEWVDNLIYLIMIADVAGINVDKAWNKKFEELNGRFKTLDPRKWLIAQADRPLEHEE